MKTVKFLNRDCNIELGKYKNGRLAISLSSAQDDESIMYGEPMGTATVNLPQINLDENNQVIIKNYSENEGILKSLQDAELIKVQTKVIPMGYVDVHVAEKTDLLKQLELETFPVVENKKKLKIK